MNDATPRAAVGPRARQPRGLVAGVVLALALAGAPVLAQTSPEIDSGERDGRFVGEIRARIAHPFATVAQALTASREWCALAILHPNIKGCICEHGTDGERVTFYAGPKRGAKLEDAYPIRYTFRTPTVTAQRIDIQLNAEQGPLKTRDYEFAISAEPAGASTTRLVVRYAYRPSVQSNLATAGYLATVGAGKHGFTIVGKDSSGRPQYVGGTRGIVERNAMRQLLAVEAYLDTRAQLDAERDRARLERFHDLTERHADQLRELDRGEYLTLKASELARQYERQRVVDGAPR